MRSLRFRNVRDRLGFRNAHVADPASVAASARDVARRQKNQLSAARLRHQPTAAYIARLTITATVAYLIALRFPGASGPSIGRPVLAPLTALLVLQASVFQTLRAGLKKVASVVTGVLLAVGLSETLPFTWWLLAVLIGSTLIIGHLLRLGEDILEVPISAMLIFSAKHFGGVASGRVIDTAIGTVAGMLGGLLFARVKTESAREAVADLASRLGDFLSMMSDGLRSAPQGQPEGEAEGAETSSGQARDPYQAMALGWLQTARALRDDIERVDDSLREAEHSVRYNPRAIGMPEAERSVHNTSLRGGLETLEHSTLYLRGLATSIVDSSRIPSEASPVRDTETRERLADVFGQLGIAIRTYGRLMRVLPSGDMALERQLDDQLTHTLHLQDKLAVLLEPDRDQPENDGTEWPLRGEILSHVDRIRTSLSPNAIPAGQTPQVDGAERDVPGSPVPRAVRPAATRAANAVRHWRLPRCPSRQPRGRDGHPPPIRARRPFAPPRPRPAPAAGGWPGRSRRARTLVPGGRRPPCGRARSPWPAGWPGRTRPREGRHRGPGAA
ncbi:MAG TPA: FUSC family protein [Trebonia sp.]|nr:FUSC family protein [Trebonia sp.]